MGRSLRSPTFPCISQGHSCAPGACVLIELLSPAATDSQAKSYALSLIQYIDHLIFKK